MNIKSLVRAMQEDFVRVSHLRHEEISQILPRTGKQDRLGYTVPENVLPKGRRREQHITR